MMFQVCRTPGLNQVYPALLSFGTQSARVVREAALVGRTFGEAALMYPGSTPLGIVRAGVRRSLPPMDTVISDSDRVVLIADNEAATAVAAATQRGEIAIGYRLAAESTNREADFGVVINPPKTTPCAFNAQDMLIVLARRDS